MKYRVAFYRITPDGHSASNYHVNMYSDDEQKAASPICAIAPPHGGLTFATAKDAYSVISKIQHEEGRSGGVGYAVYDYLGGVVEEGQVK